MPAVLSDLQEPEQGCWGGCGCPNGKAFQLKMELGKCFSVRFLQSSAF